MFSKPRNLPKISIVTISLNQAEFVETALNSVIGQDYRNKEYIVLDPGSRDGSRDIIRRHAAGIDHIVFESDTGPADALNRGFGLATGDIYGYLNSDDVLAPGSLTRVAQLFSDHLDVDVITGHVVVIDRNGKELRRSYSDRFDARAYAYGMAVIMQVSTFFRAELFKQTSGFNTENRSNWDGELFLDLLEAGGRLMETEEFFGFYRVHEESITGTAKRDDDIREYQQRVFNRIMRRRWRAYDGVFREFYRMRKYALNPRALLERIRGGPIYGRNL